MVVIKGKLKLKGKFQRKLDDEKRELNRKIEAKKDKLNGLADLKSLKSKGPKKKTIVHPEKNGTGRILTSGKSVMGKDTQFLDEVKRGDFLVIMDRINFTKESQEVSMIFSDKSLGLKTPFSKNISTYTQYMIKPQDEVVEEDPTIDEKYKSRIEEMTKKSISKPKTLVEIKRKKGMWGYETVKKEFDKELTREEMLDLRSKVKKDKWCW